MKIFLTSLIFCFSFLLTHAQQDRFIYLQTENNQPFFVKLNNKTFSSSQSGYLIIPKLDDGLYSLVIGFPETTNEQEFNCSVNNKDVGFIIKNTGEKQWQLLNLQSNTVIVPGDVITKPVVIYEKETDPFSTMLASAVHDSTILRKDIAKATVSEKAVELPPKDTVVVVASKDIAISKDALIADSTGKEVAKSALPEKSGEVTQKDTTQTTSPTLVVSKTDTPGMDSTKNDIAKVTTTETGNEAPQKDTAKAVSGDEVVVLKPGTVNDVAKDIPAQKSDESVQTDTTQRAVSNNDVAVTKSARKKKAKKNDNALQDSAMAQKDTVKEVAPEKVNENKEAFQSPPVDVAIVRSTIKRKSKKNSREGVVMTYIDDNGETTDTITILIPSEKKIKTDVSEPVVSIPVQEDNPKDNSADKNKADYIVTKEEKQIIKEAKKEPVFISSMINSDCKSFASEEDFLKVRKKMVAENNDEDMIKAARKYFKTKCFTTEQIKNLSVLFLKDEGKYMFFDAAYPFVSDSDQYSVLEKQLSDEYYINRFRAMVHK
jgi:hypothetical protein